MRLFINFTNNYKLTKSVSGLSEMRINCVFNILAISLNKTNHFMFLLCMCFKCDVLTCAIRWDSTEPFLKREFWIVKLSRAVYSKREENNTSFSCIYIQGELNKVSLISSWDLCINDTKIYQQNKLLKIILSIIQEDFRK